MMTNMVEFVINGERSKMKMHDKKSESTNVSSKSKELKEYIDITNGALLDTYDYLVKHTRILLDTEVSDEQRSYLEWSLAHIHTDMLKLHESLKNMQKALRENR